jgi:hypothetical protein
VILNQIQTFAVLGRSKMLLDRFARPPIGIEAIKAPALIDVPVLQPQDTEFAPGPLYASTMADLMPGNRSTLVLVTHGDPAVEGLFISDERAATGSARLSDRGGRCCVV